MAFSFHISKCFTRRICFSPSSLICITRNLYPSFPTFYLRLTFFSPKSSSFNTRVPFPFPRTLSVLRWVSWSVAVEGRRKINVEIILRLLSASVSVAVCFVERRPVCVCEATLAVWRGISIRLRCCCRRGQVVLSESLLPFLAEPAALLQVSLAS